MTASDNEANQTQANQSADQGRAAQGEAGKFDKGAQRASYQGQGDRQQFEKPRTAAMEVAVENNIEKAMKVLKRKLIKEGLFKELKSRRYFEKPCERRKRKLKESMKKIRKEEARSRKNPYF